MKHSSIVVDRRAETFSNRYAPLDIDTPDKLYVSTLRQNNAPSIEFQTMLVGKSRMATAQTLLDSGATGNLLNRDYAIKHRIKQIPLSRHIPLRNADESETIVKTYAELDIRIKDHNGNTHQEQNRFYIADIGRQDVILGTDWLIEHNPTIDWRAYRMTLNRCPRTCIQQGQIDLYASKQFPAGSIKPEPRIVRRIHLPSEQGRKIGQNELNSSILAQEEKNHSQRQRKNMKLPQQLWTVDEEELHEYIPSTGTYLGLRNAKIIKRVEVEAKYSNHAQRLAQEAQKKSGKEEKTLEQMVPPQYHQFLKVFSKKESERFPTSKRWDHAIDLKPDFKPKDCKIYPLSPAEQKELSIWINEQLNKGYIRESKSEMASPFFFVGKKDGSKRPTQNYKYLNSGTVKNTYPLPLISEIIDKLKGAKYFTKMDIRWGYQNILIKEGDQWKAAFKTNNGLFEPLVMYFGMTNSPATFQTMMNEIFRDLMDKGVVIVYMDDILVFTKTMEEHQSIVKEVLKRLLDNDLFAKPEKCEFEKEQIEYLGLGISHNKVKMDPVKVDGITKWPQPTKVKEIQAFLGFCNFYRRFIRDFSKIARPLFELTKKDHEWNWTEQCNKAFENLKEIFITAPMLTMPDTTKPMRLECDASDFARGAVLSQKEDDGLYHPVSYISKSLSEAERNYDIHDKELLSIIEALDSWRHYLEGCDHQIEIWTDHRNLEYFQKSQKLNRRQARWAQFLSRFDFILEHKPGKTNKADGLSRRIDHKKGIEKDNSDQTLLPAELFAKSAYFKQTIQGHELFNTRFTGRGNGQTEHPNIAKRIRIRTNEIMEDNAVIINGDEELRDKIRTNQELDDEVSAALETIKTAGPRSMISGLKEWNLEDGLILFRGKIYVPKDNELRKEVVKSCHDPQIMGHPGRYKTLVNVQQNFWWPGMSIFVKNYVEGCARCQETKNITHPSREPLHPTEIPTRPFQNITANFITDLPKSKGYDSILMITDQGTKTVITEPCHKTIDANRTAEILIKKVFCRYGLSEKLISDRGPQFASKVMRAVLKAMGVRSALSTAFHPQTDGSSERANQGLEQYLRAYCNRNQDNWVSLLPMADFAHNTQEHSATKRTPFELLHGYTPRWIQSFIPNEDIPKADERLQELQHAREEAIAAVHIATEAMKIQHDKYGDKGPDFKIDDQVWLEGKNLKTMYPSAKLSPKRYGPFTITALIGTGAYRLTLPPTWNRIHPVFHASLLTPYKETEAHGPNYTRPPPDLIEGQDEYEVEEITKAKQYGRWKKWKYFIKWKGYPESDMTWEYIENLEGAHDLVVDYHRRHPELPKPASLTIALLNLTKKKRDQVLSIIDESREARQTITPQSKRASPRRLSQAG